MHLCDPFLLILHKFDYLLESWYSQLYFRCNISGCTSYLVTYQVEGHILLSECVMTNKSEVTGNNISKIANNIINNFTTKFDNSHGSKCSLQLRFRSNTGY